MTAIEMPDIVPCEMVLVTPLPHRKPDPADYRDEFDDMSCIGGESVDVKVLYWNDKCGIDVFTMDDNFEADRDVTGEISLKEYDDLFRKARMRAASGETEAQRIVREDSQAREFCECGDCVTDRGTAPCSFSPWWVKGVR